MNELERLEYVEKWLSLYQEQITQTLEQENRSSVPEIAETHWKYIKALLECCVGNALFYKPELINMIGFHYLTAFEHGWQSRGIHDVSTKLEELLNK
ncbi:MAG: hypothetical protein HQK65_10630 [Desulfamplus sp.]|nr:hypothetical protein [Desulfamplus sp.]